jgi:hypothetical protein
MKNNIHIPWSASMLAMQKIINQHEKIMQSFKPILINVEATNIAIQKMIMPPLETYNIANATMHRINQSTIQRTYAGFESVMQNCFWQETSATIKAAAAISIMPASANYGWIQDYFSSAFRFPNSISEKAFFNDLAKYDALAGFSVLPPYHTTTRNRRLRMLNRAKYLQTRQVIAEFSLSTRKKFNELNTEKNRRILVAIATFLASLCDIPYMQMQEHIELLYNIKNILYFINVVCCVLS